MDTKIRLLTGVAGFAGRDVEPGEVELLDRCTGLLRTAQDSSSTRMWVLPPRTRAANKTDNGGLGAGCAVHLISNQVR